MEGQGVSVPLETKPFLDSKSPADDKMLDKLQPTDTAVREVGIVRRCLGYYI